MTLLMASLKAGVTIALSVLLTLVILKGKPSCPWVEVDVTKLLQKQALSLGQQHLSEIHLQEKIQSVLPSILSAAAKLSQRHKVVIFRKGAALSPVPDWTDRVAQALEAEE